MQDAWQTTGRLDIYDQELFKLADRKGKRLLLGATNEEMATILASSIITSHHQLSKTIFTISNKFRDELRANHGLIRTKEFLMMDAYSFDSNEETLSYSYNRMRDLFIEIFKKLGIKYYIKSSDTGEIGGSYSEEFIATTSIGDIEIAHIFKLDDKYSNLLNATFTGFDNRQHNLFMGCYGIGITRLIQVIADQYKTDEGLGWSKSTAAFDMAIIIVDANNCLHQSKAMSIIADNSNKNILIDDRDISFGRKINDIKLMGLEYKIVGNQ